MKSGFILIELLISLVITSLMGVALFNGFAQTNQFTQVVDSFINISSKAAIVHQQLDHDITGICIPFSAVEEEKEAKEPEKPEQEPKKEAEARKEDKRKERKPLTHVFFSKNKGELLDTLTFITNNPLQVYWSEKAGEAKPRIARVVYRLEKEDGQKDTYRLLRQESNQLAYEAFGKEAAKPVRALELIDGIKNFSINFSVATERKEEGEEKGKRINVEYKVLKEWDREQIKKDEQKKMKPLPDLLIIALTLWDDKKERDVSFEFKIPILVTEYPEKKQKKKTEQQPKSLQQQRGALQQTQGHGQRVFRPGENILQHLLQRVGA